MEEAFALSIGKWLLAHTVQDTVRIVCSLIEALFDQLVIFVCYFLLFYLPLERANARVRLALRAFRCV